MNIIKMYRSRKYLLRLFLSITLSVTVLLLISATLQFYNSRQTVLENQQETNKKVLYQVSYNIDYMSELVKTLTMSMYFDADTISLMNMKSIEISELYPKINRFIKIANSTAFIHSIMVYNVFNDCYYATTSNATCLEDETTRSISQYLTGHAEVPKLAFVPMSLNKQLEHASRLDFFSYFMYEALDNTYRQQSAFIVNLKPEWLFNNVNNINQLIDRKESSLLIIDSKGAVINPNVSDMAGAAEVSGKVIAHLTESGKTMDYFTTGVGANKTIVSYLTSTVNNWIVVHVQSYDSVLGNIDKMRTTSMAMIGIFLILSTAGSIVLSLKLYRPIENLIQQIQQSSNDINESALHGKDELNFISNEYRQAVEGMKWLEKKQNTKNHIMKTYYLRKLATNSSTVSFQEFREDMTESGLKIDLGGLMLLCVLKIDDYNEFHTNIRDSDKALCKFAISNIAEEIVSAKFNVEIVDMRNDHLLALINIGDPPDRAYDELTFLFGEIQRTILNFYAISLTVAFSEPISGYKPITKYYGQALEHSLYRLIFGKMSIITPKMLESNIENQEFQIPAELERKLAESIKSNNHNHIHELVSNLADFVSSLNYNNINYCLLYTIAIVKNAIREINNRNVHQVFVDLHSFQRKVLDLETLEEVWLAFNALLEEISEKRKHFANDDRNDIIASTVKEIIEENYMDVNLSLQGISTMMKLSTKHISRIFRNQESYSVADYITEVRLNHSLKLLENHYYSINDVMEKVGFSNQSYFFKLFKKRYGTTPKEFRIKKVVR